MNELKTFSALTICQLKIKGLTDTFNFKKDHVSTVLEIKKMQMSQSLKILIVDDEFLIRKALTLSAEKKGHKVKSAENGTEGLKVWLDFKPDLVFLDVLMPDMDGFTVLKKIPENLKTKVILISAHDDLRQKEIENAGADLFIKKPFPDIFQLIEQAEKLVKM